VFYTQQLAERWRSSEVRAQIILPLKWNV
jgi:hypothetical protein